MLLSLFACSRGPLVLPTLDVEVPNGPCDVPGEGIQGDDVRATVEAREPRLFEIVDLVDDRDQLDAYDGVVPYVHVVVAGDRVTSAELGEGESLPLEAHGTVYCDHGATPGRYTRDVPVVSTDVLGGDEVEQTITVQVTVVD